MIANIRAKFSGKEKEFHDLAEITDEIISPKDLSDKIHLYYTKVYGEENEEKRIRRGIYYTIS